MAVTCIRVHDLVSGEADPGGASVVLVDRLWPRGVRKDAFAHDEWCKDAAPSPELRTEFHGGDLDFAEFSERYRAELDSGEGAEAVDHLAGLAADPGVVLAYAAKDTEHNHALVLAEVVRAAARGGRHH
ncbi:DUF488 family protein [Dietzia aurantiaca]|uniref:DUF488 domain-containing protein n=1 Tax=Dietzia aurantiaca TaxID=983873 RepID=UPI001E62B6A2|nr:DUF488 family protein [Dietzia aurantiaca]MCD2263767.1 DUF488 family protein [Dietzia aurantiaca]